MKRFLMGLLIACVSLPIALWILAGNGKKNGFSGPLLPPSLVSAPENPRRPGLPVTGTSGSGVGARSEDVANNQVLRHPGKEQPRATEAPPPERRPWDPGFLTNLKNAAPGSPIHFELVAGKRASGNLGHLETRRNGLIYVSGELTQPEPGRFFFQQQPRAGVAGEFVGVVEFPASGTAYRLEPTGLGGTAELVKRKLGQVLCVNLPRPGGGGSG
jgi:hypothetical protein